MNRFVLPVANLPNSFYDIATEVENAFDHLFNGKASGENKNSSRYSPRLSIYEYDDKFVVSVDLPGMKPEEVHIEMKDSQLSIAGERAVVVNKEGMKAWRDERNFGTFRRVLQLPENVDGDNIDAVYDAGVLTVTVPKAPKPTARQITIRSANPSTAVQAVQPSNIGTEGSLNAASGS